MTQYILMCRSMTTAQKAVNTLLRAGIFAAMSKAPQSANPEGCTYGAKIGERNLQAARSVLADAGVPVGKILELTRNGIREVRP